MSRPRRLGKRAGSPSSRRAAESTAASHCPHDLHLGIEGFGGGPVLHCQKPPGHDGTHTANGLHWTTTHADEARRLAEAYASGGSDEAAGRRCARCRFWIRNDVATRRSTHGRCTSGAFEFASSLVSTMREDGLVYWDVELRGASFETGGDFGCRHFERATAPPRTDRPPEGDA